MTIYSWQLKMHRSSLIPLALLSLSHWHRRQFAPIWKMGQPFVAKQISIHEVRNIRGHSHPLIIYASSQKMHLPAHKQSVPYAVPISLLLAQEISTPAYYLTCSFQISPVPCVSPKPRKSIFAT